MNYFRPVILFCLMLLGLYFSISSIIALPLLDEDSQLEQTDKFDYKNQVDSIAKLTAVYLQNFKLDSLNKKELAMVQAVDSNAIFNPASLQQITTFNKDRDIQQVLVYAGSLKTSYSLIGEVGRIAKNKYRQAQLEKFSNFCEGIKSKNYFYFYNANYKLAEIMTNYQIDHKTKRIEILTNLLQLRKILKAGSLRNFNVDKAPSNQSLGIFIIGNWALGAESQNIAIIIGLIGVAVFGSVLGAANPQTNQPADEQLVFPVIVFNLLVLLMRGIAAAFLVYMSIKAGLSLVGTSSGNKLNPYVILFSCFIAAVYSDEIWVWAKSKLISNKSPGGGHHISKEKKATQPI